MLEDGMESPKEQLDLIATILCDSREALKDNSFPFIIWGGLVSLCTIGTMTLVNLKLFNLIGWLWCIGWLISFIIVFMSYRKKEKQVRYQSTRILSAVWGAVAMGGAIPWLISLLGNTGFALNEAMSTLAILLSVGYLVTAVLTAYRMLYAGAVAWMIYGCVCLFLASPLAAYGTGAMSFLFMFIPGLIMRNKEHLTK